MSEREQITAAEAAKDLNTFNIVGCHLGRIPQFGLVGWNIKGETIFEALQELKQIRPDVYSVDAELIDATTGNQYLGTFTKIDGTWRQYSTVKHWQNCNHCRNAVADDEGTMRNGRIFHTDCAVALHDVGAL